MRPFTECGGFTCYIFGRMSGFRVQKGLIMLIVKDEGSYFCGNYYSFKLPVLIVGEERRRESLAYFDGSSREYEVQGLQNGKWYEIKISYPASVCSFSPLTRCADECTTLHF